LLLLVGQVSANDQFDGADEFIRAAVEHWEVPGVAIAAVKDGQVVLAQGYEAVGAIWKPSFFIREGSSSRITVLPTSFAPAHGAASARCSDG
jgi:hypothetical protein